VLNDCVEARGFSGMPNIEEHNTFKKLKVVRCAIHAFFPELKERCLLLHEDNQSVIIVLTHLTSKSPTMVCDLCKLFLLIDTYDIKIRTQYIRSATNMRADNLTRVTDNTDRQLAPKKFKHFNKEWGPHTIDRFDSNANKQLPRYNAKWRNSTTEVVDCLHLSDA
jgi:hypothetical protein